MSYPCGSPDLLGLGVSACLVDVGHDHAGANFHHQIGCDRADSPAAPFTTMPFPSSLGIDHLFFANILIFFNQHDVEEADIGDDHALKRS